MVANKIYFGDLVAAKNTHVLTGAIAKLQERHEQFLRVLNGLYKEKAVLEQSPLIYAVPYWRPGKSPDQKYLYLNYPTQKGQPRKREYVGADPAKIKSAELGIQRAKEYEALKSRIESLEVTAKQVAFHLNQALHLLKVDI